MVNSADETFDSDDFNKPEKLEAFIQSIFDSQKTSSSLMHFFFLRLRQSEKIHFQRSSEVAVMGEKVGSFFCFWCCSVDVTDRISIFRLDRSFRVGQRCFAACGDGLDQHCRFAEDTHASSNQYDP